jgi:hemolysin III
MNNREQTLREEIINAITHGFGIVFTLCGIPLLLQKAYVTGSLSAYYAVLIFGIAMFAVYFFSTLYHSVQSPKLKNKLNICDQISIFILIGGSYLPFVLQYTDTQTATIFLMAQWLIILIGALLKLFFIKKYEKALLFVYVFLGWSVVFLVKPFSQTMPFEVVKWILLGCGSYSIGVFFYRWKKQKYAHAIWHLFVLVGTICHYWAAYKMYENS